MIRLATRTSGSLWLQSTSAWAWICAREQSASCSAPSSRPSISAGLVAVRTRDRNARDARAVKSSIRRGDEILAALGFAPKMRDVPARPVPAGASRRYASDRSASMRSARAAAPAPSRSDSSAWPWRRKSGDPSSPSSCADASAERRLRQLQHHGGAREAVGAGDARRRSPVDPVSYLRHSLSRNPIVTITCNGWHYSASSGTLQNTEAMLLRFGEAQHGG